MSNPTTIVTLSDVHDFLGIPSNQTGKDVSLQRYIDAATRWAQYVSDAILPTTYTNEVHSGGVPQIVLFNTPILSVTSVIEYVASYAYPLTRSEAGGDATFGYSIDNPDAGIITRRYNGMVGNFMGGISNVVITYEAGFAIVPADIQTYVLMDIQALFDASSQGSRPSVSGNDFGYSSTLPLNVFPRLASLMASSRRVPAVG